MRFKRLKILRRKENDLNIILEQNAEDIVFQYGLFKKCSDIVSYYRFYMSTNDPQKELVSILRRQMREPLV